MSAMWIRQVVLASLWREVYSYCIVRHMFPKRHAAAGDRSSACVVRQASILPFCIQDCVAEYSTWKQPYGIAWTTTRTITERANAVVLVNE
jgi:hypothetical protein